jgi:glycosyltransferase involved in cell wall biosynthesis
VTGTPPPSGRPQGVTAPVVKSGPVPSLSDDLGTPHRISVVIPVYQGEKTLPSLIEEITRLASVRLTPAGHPREISEILLVHDNGPDGSDLVIRQLEETNELVRGVWLSRNFGQHAATLAGMASTGGDWVATIDEDGQHDPAYLDSMLDTAMAEQAALVYARPTNAAPHGPFRNAASKGAKAVLRAVFGDGDASLFQSYRLILGDVARSVSAYAGSGVYLDVAISWVTRRVTTSPVELREEGDRASGYSTRKLLSHFWRMVLTSGTRGLRVVSVLGVVLAALGLLFALYVIVSTLSGRELEAGWSSTIVVVLLSSGAVLFSLGIVAEYIGVAVNMAMGRPSYLIVSDPGRGPLGRRRQTKA